MRRGPPIIELRWNQAVVRQLITTLLEPEDKKYIQEMDKLIEENDTFHGQYTVGFNYLGKSYGRGGSTFRGGVALHPSLFERMTRVAQLRRDVDWDRDLLAKFLDKLTQNCTTNQAIRDALPECLVALDSVLVAIPRQHPEAWPFRDKPFDMQMYQKVLTKIQTYLAMRYLY